MKEDRTQWQITKPNPMPDPAPPTDEACFIMTRYFDENKKPTDMLKIDVGVYEEGKGFLCLENPLRPDKSKYPYHRVVGWRRIEPALEEAKQFAAFILTDKKKHADELKKLFNLFMGIPQECAEKFWEGVI